MGKKIVFILALVLVAFASKAQNTIISGIVTDSITGETLPYVSVILKGTTIGTTTDDDGKFTLTTSSNARTLSVSYLGYTEKELKVAIGKKNYFKIPLAPSSIDLGEVIVKPKKEKYSKKENPAVAFVKKVIESRESIAPEKADKMTMGASVQWYSVDNGRSSSFPDFSYGVEFNDKNCEKVLMGEWTWETGMNLDQIKDFERIRDYGMLVVYSNWSYLKNQMKENTQYRNRKLGWVAYVAGKRESRRLMGDYILKEDDITKNVTHEDASFATTWSIDLHWQDPANSAHFPGNEFKAVTKHILIHPYPVPYRCLYSRNIDNLFMAGRNISVTHVALGTVRVMRTTGMMGEVVGMAASLCKKYGVEPRKVYQSYLEELKVLMKEGVNKKGLPNNQRYNEGGILKEKPVVK